MSVAPRAAPPQRLLPLVAAVLAAHFVLLHLRSATLLQPGAQALRSFTTRTIAAAPSAPPPAPPPQPAAPKPRVVQSEVPAPAPAPAPAPEAAPPPPDPLEGFGMRGRTVAPAPDSTPAAAAPPATAADVKPRILAIPEPARLHYEVHAEVRGFSVSGQAEFEWKHDGTQYEARLVARGIGLGTREQRSSGRITDEGLAPTQFRDKSRSEQATHFERDKGRVTFSNNRPEAPLAAGMQDRLSVVVQLAVMIAGQPSSFPPGTQIAVPTASTREAENWIFQVEGEEELQLPGGKVRGLKLLRQPRKEFDQKIELWLAPRMDYAPVRVRLTNPNGDVVDQRWASTDKG